MPSKQSYILTMICPLSEDFVSRRWTLTHVGHKDLPLTRGLPLARWTSIIMVSSDVNQHQHQIMMRPIYNAGWGKLWIENQTTSIRYGARMGGPKYYAVNLILRLFLYHFLHMMSSWCHESIHNNTNNQQTPPPWWWSRSPLQRRGFDESTLSKWRAALLMFVPRPLLKGFGRINKLK